MLSRHEQGETEMALPKLTSRFRRSKPEQPSRNLANGAVAERYEAWMSHDASDLLPGHSHPHVHGGNHDHGHDHDHGDGHADHQEADEHAHSDNRAIIADAAGDLVRVLLTGSQPKLSRSRLETWRRAFLGTAHSR